MVCHDFTKFGDHRYCGSRDITFLVCLNMIKGSRGYIDRSPLRQVINLRGLVPLGNVVLVILWI